MKLITLLVLLLYFPLSLAAEQCPSSNECTSEQYKALYANSTGEDIKVQLGSDEYTVNSKPLCLCRPLGYGSTTFISLVSDPTNKIMCTVNIKNEPYTATTTVKRDGETIKCDKDYS